ncbi:MAG: hypothetical protein V7711_04205 [Pseudomonadales bacterium]
MADDEKPDKETSYDGPERRIEQRRKQPRRKQVRFEPKQEDRRKDHGKRVEDLDLWNKRDL